MSRYLARVFRTDFHIPVSSYWKTTSPRIQVILGKIVINLIWLSAFFCKEMNVPQDHRCLEERVCQNSWKSRMCVPYSSHLMLSCILYTRETKWGKRGFPQSIRFLTVYRWPFAMKLPFYWCSIRATFPFAVSNQLHRVQSLWMKGWHKEQ